MRSWRSSLLLLGGLALAMACAVPAPRPTTSAEIQPPAPLQPSQPPEEDSSVVEVGLERLQELGSPRITESLRNRRLGLVAHRASVTEDGKHAIDVLNDLGLNLVKIFSPEHGLRGGAAAGEAVAGGRDPVSGRPVVSLYGPRTKPSLEDLGGIDVLLFDLQGAGVRFYTYVSTLIQCLEVAAEAGVEVIVLDRPNPLGGDKVEGPVSAPRHQVPESFVNLAPGPMIHGLTLGEMARLVNAELVLPAQLTVVPMRHWKRRMTWRDTGRTWIPPSPNLRSPEAALAYPGIALLEASNVSEGRGTPTPFLLFGAPWLDQELAGELATQIKLDGFILEPTVFTPTSSPAAPNPKFLDQECNGLRVRVITPDIASSYRLGIAVALALQDHPEFEWRRRGEALTWLVGTDRLHQQLLERASLEEILAADDREHREWQKQRRRYLLYP